jgi:hypothetical protein
VLRYYTHVGQFLQSIIATENASNLKNAKFSIGVIGIPTIAHRKFASSRVGAWHCVVCYCKGIGVNFNHMAWKTSVQVTSLVFVGLGGWFTGILTERRTLRQSTCYCSCVNQSRPDNLLHKLKGMPGLPIFGTVSAASSPGNKLNVLENDVVSLGSSPVASKPSRVSQVK